MNKGMNCKTVSRMLRALPLAEIDPRDRLRIDEHLTFCSKCHSLADSMSKMDRMLALVATEAPALAATRPVGFASSRLRFAAYGITFLAMAVAGAGFGMKYGVGSLFGEAYAADLTNPVLGLKNIAFDEGRFGADDDWSARYGDGKIALPIDSLRGTTDVPNFYEFDGATTRRGEGRALRLYLRSFGGSVSRTIEGPFPAGTLISLRAWVYMPQSGSTRNKWLSVGVGAEPVSASDRSWTTSLDVFDGSPLWRPYTLTTGLPNESRSITFSFSTGAGDGRYKGWERSAWIDDVQVAVEIPLKGFARWTGREVVARLAVPQGLRLSDTPEDLQLWTYGDKLPLLKPSVVSRSGSELVCTYRHADLGQLIARGNPDTGNPTLPVQIRTRLTRNGHAFVGTFGAFLSALPKP